MKTYVVTIIYDDDSTLPWASEVIAKSKSKAIDATWDELRSVDKNVTDHIKKIVAVLK